MTETEKQDVLEYANFVFPGETFTDADLEQIKSDMDLWFHKTEPNHAGMSDELFAQISDPNIICTRQITPEIPVTVELDPAYELAIMLMLVALGFYFDVATETFVFADGYAQYFPDTHSIFVNPTWMFGDLDKYLSAIAELDALSQD